MRITSTFLKTRAARVFEACGLDIGPVYVDGKARIGATYLAKGFSGWDIEQIANEGGAIRQLNGYCNSLSAKEMLAFLDGMEFAATRLETERKAVLKRLADNHATGQPLTFETLREVDALVKTV